MAATLPIPFTAIENSIINECLPRIGLAGLGVYVVIKKFLNQKSGQCNPSYQTIARKAGVDRSTIIRYVKKLKTVNLIDPELRFREDGGYASNQYNFSTAAQNPPSQKPDNIGTGNQETPASGGEKQPPPLVVEENHPSGATATTPSGSHATSPGAPVPPEQSSSSNKRERTTPDIASLPTPMQSGPTEKQKTCPHPSEEIAHLSENIIVCNHCFALLDENPTLANITLPHFPESALPECDPDYIGGTGGEATPGRETQDTNETETALKMVRKSPQIAVDREKAGKMTNSLVRLGKVLVGCLTCV
jgi:Helix-turn-helix domain